MNLRQTHAIRYGISGLAISASSLPLYVLIPKIYANLFTLSLIHIGAILMIVRLTDAVTDPIVGRLLDATRSRHRFPIWAIPSGIIMAVSYIALILPPEQLHSVEALVYMGSLTLIVSVSTGVLNVTIQTWPARWTENAEDQSTLVSRREQFTLLGVIIAIAISTIISPEMFAAYLCTVTILMCLSICDLPTPTVSSSNLSKPSNTVFKDFKSLLTPLFLSSLANAISATTFIFYVTDYLIFSEKEGGLLLGIYFVCALSGIWFWQKFIRIKSPLSVYILSIMATLVVFIPAGFLTKNNADAFYLVCVLSGLTLGAELILPSILLIAKLKHLRMENKSGVVFGSWSLLVKLALAVAAGLSLPILGYFKYTPGEDTGLFMLPVVYVVVPVLLKIATMILLVIHHKKYANIYRQTHI